MTNIEFERFAIQKMLEIREAYKQFLPEEFENGDVYFSVSAVKNHICVTNTTYEDKSKQVQGFYDVNESEFSHFEYTKLEDGKPDYHTSEHPMEN